MLLARLGVFAAAFSLFSVWGQTLQLADPRAAQGYRLIAPLTFNTAYLVDNAGNVVHTWTSEYPLATVAKLLPNGNLLRTAGFGDSTYAGGQGGRIEEIAWDSSVVWSFELSDDNYILHHDAQKLPNGNYLLILWERKTPDQAAEIGVPVDRVPNGILNERIVEIQPHPGSGADVVWQWNLWDHLIQNQDPARTNYGDIATNNHRVDVNFTVDGKNADLFHFNAVDYNAELDQIMISVRNFSEFWIVDHSTTMYEAATDSGGRSGKGGGILYRWGNVAAWSGGPFEAEKLGGQHNAHWIEPGLPGAGHVLVFNNLVPDTANISAVYELELPVNADGSYWRDPAKDFQPDEPVWKYVSPQPNELFSSFISGAQRLPNGNTLICSGAQAKIIEVTESGEVVWSYQAGYQPDGRPVNVFRSYWYPTDYEGFLGTEIFQSTSH